MSYYESTASASYISNQFNLDARFYTLAMNIVREGSIALGRGDYPFTDNDGAIMHNVYLQLKNMSGESGVNRQQEHQYLAATKDAPHPAQEKIAAVFDKIDDEIRAEVEPLVKAKVPSAKA